MSTQSTMRPTRRPSATGSPPRRPPRSPRPPAPRRVQRRRGQIRWRRIIALVLVVLLTCVGWSFGTALAGPGNDALSIRSTEWLKDHYFAWAVNDVERWWYSHHKPKSGGVPTGALGRTLQSGAGQAARPPAPGTSRPTGTGTAPAHLPAPAAITPIAAGRLPGEGQWKPLGQSVAGAPSMYAAFLRPDPIHTSLLTGVAWMDPNLVKAVGYAGVTQPGGGPWLNEAPIPAALRPQLLAAFNSGFKMSDARGGYYADGRTVRPLVAGAATLVISPNGTPDVGQWGRDFALGPNVGFARQNLSLIVDGGHVVPGLASDSSAKWGATLGNKVFVWRSGAGVTANGALVYAAGNGLSATTLAGVLARAGAVRAMELDINSAWVDFFTYSPAAPGQPPAAVGATKLLPDMSPSPSKYFAANSRDFIAVFRRY